MNEIKDIGPNDAESLFLSLSYNRFYDIFEEVMKEEYWDNDGWYRYCKARDGFAVYTELLSYKPIKWVLEEVEEKRPPMEAEIGRDLFKFIRNLITHFPFYENWDEVWFNKKLINWSRPNQSIDKFLDKYVSHSPVKYRFWEKEKKKMTYTSINFPTKYDDDKLLLKDIIDERDGVSFSFTFMKQILDTQVISIKDKT